MCLYSGTEDDSVHIQKLSIQTVGVRGRRERIEDSMELISIRVCVCDCVGSKQNRCGGRKKSE